MTAGIIATDAAYDDGKTVGGKLTNINYVRFHADMTGYDDSGTSLSAWSNWEMANDDGNHYYYTFYTAQNQSEKGFGWNAGKSGSGSWGPNWYTMNGEKFSGASSEKERNFDGGSDDKLSTISSSSGWVKVQIDFWGAYNNDSKVKFVQNAVSTISSSVSVGSSTLASGGTTTVTPSSSGGTGSTTNSVKVYQGSTSGTDVTASVLSGTTFTAPNVASNTTYYIVNTATDSKIGAYSVASSAATITVSSPLTAPTIKYNNATTTPVSLSSSEGSKARITWGKITNAGSYEVFKDGVSQGTVTTLYYDIERGYSYGGTYTVKAIPSNSASYGTSAASNAIEFTFNRTKLNKPTVTPTSKDVDKGSTVDFTLTNTNTSYTAGTVYKYQHTGESNSTYSDVTNLAWTTSALNTEGDRVFKFKATSLKTDYFEDSDETTATINVSCYKYCLTGDMVTGQGGDAGWPTAITNYPVDTFVSKNVYYTSVTVSGGKSSDKHYFRLTNQSNQYTVTSGVNTDMASHDSASTAVTASITGTNGAMYVTGNGTFKIYVNQNTSGSPKVWVVCEDWSLTTTAYYATFNLATDTHNQIQKGTTGGTASPGSVEVTKGSSTTLTATAESGYYFDGWYNNTDFAAGHKVSSTASYEFTPSSNGDYYALFKQTIPTHYTVSVAVNDTSYATVTATYNGNTISTSGSGTLSVPVGASVTYSITTETGCQIESKSPSELITSTSGSFTMPSSNTEVSVGASRIKYTITSAIIPDHGTLKFYSDETCETELAKVNGSYYTYYNETFYAKYTPADDYQLVNYYVVPGTGATHESEDEDDRSNNIGEFKMGNSNTTIYAYVMLQYSVNYYIDMHSTDMTDKTVNVAVVSDDSDNADTLEDKDGDPCAANLVNIPGTDVYSAQITTPIDTGDPLYFKITYNNTTYRQTLAAAQVTALKSKTTKDVWLEARNETSLELDITTAANSTRTVADGYRRIYLAKPVTRTSSNWSNIRIYYWTTGNYNNGWEASNQSGRMNYLGYDATYYYYYADIPKVNPNDNTIAINDLLFQGCGNDSNNWSFKEKSNDVSIDGSNFFILANSGSGVSKGENVIVPDYTSYKSAAQMNVTLKQGEVASIKPSYNGEDTSSGIVDITYASSNTSVVTVDADGKLTPQSSGTAAITVKVYGTIGALLITEDSNNKDYRTYTVSVTVHDPGKLDQFYIMAIESSVYTVTIPAILSQQPAYFDMSGVAMTVTGIQGVTSSTGSAIITSGNEYNVPDGIGNKPISFTVKYAKANTVFSGYSGIQITGTIVTNSIRYSDASRYGFKNWNPNPTGYSSSKKINNGVETATIKNFRFDNAAASQTYQAIFEAYTYVDVTFVFDYDEYLPRLDNNDTPDDSSDDMYNYFYESDWADESKTNGNYASSHRTAQYTVVNYEVRAANGQSRSDIITNANIATASAIAIGVSPQNNYYNYSVSSENVSTDPTVPDQTYNITRKIHLTQTVRKYSVYLNNDPQNPTPAASGLTYQQYVNLSAPTGHNLWYAVGETSTTIDESTDPLIATGSNYSFRVKGNTYLMTQNGTVPEGNNFNRSEVDFSHYEVTHRNNVDYLLQNFYIADFFSPEKVLSDRLNSAGTGYLPYDDATFVGGGVVYYSVDNQGKPRSNNAVVLDLVNKANGTINEASIKEMLKNNIEAQLNKDDIAGVVGDEDAKKIAYGTEIKAQQYVNEDQMKSGVLYRYLPLNSYTRYGTGEKSVNVDVVSNTKIVNYSLGDSRNNDDEWYCSSSVSGDDDTALADGKRTIRFTNTKNWDAVFVHYWQGVAEASNWPGVRMTETETAGVFEVTIPSSAEKIVFNDGDGKPATDSNGTFTMDYSVNKNTFRYSNSLQSYQYVYASGNENKETNNGRNMRLYSYYVYSYVTYNKDTNVPETKYEIVLSDNYSDASTYWDGTN